jgi:hypothetical protein
MTAETCKPETLEILALAVSKIEEAYIAKVSEVRAATSEMNLLKVQRHDLHARYAAQMKANNLGRKAQA